MARRMLPSILPLLGLSLLAQEGADAEVLKAFERLQTVPVVSASRLPQDPTWAPAKVVVVTASDLRRRGYLDLEEVLHDLAGFDFEKGFGSHWSQIYMRGERSTNSDRFILIWDGVIQNDIWAQVTWFERQFPLSAIDRIEVMYGPASLLYGSNAMSGIIQVFTRKPEDIQGVQVQAKGGSFDTRAIELLAATYPEIGASASWAGRCAPSIATSAANGGPITREGGAITACASRTTTTSLR